MSGQVIGTSGYLDDVAARGPALYWTLTVEVAAVVLLMALTFYLQIRKRDFL